MLGCPLSWFSRKCLLFVGFQGVNKPTCFLVKLSISVPALTWALIRTEIIWRCLVPHLRLGTWGREGCGSPAFHPQLSLTWAVSGALCSSAASGVCWRLCWSCVPPELLCVPLPAAISSALMCLEKQSGRGFLSKFSPLQNLLFLWCFNLAVAWLALLCSLCCLCGSD